MRTSEAEDGRKVVVKFDLEVVDDVLPSHGHVVREVLLKQEGVLFVALEV